ncbi:helix-turn-helix domain-containing protein [Dyadobacter psychrotolerans]|uniref:AraC family transcriptional regulator n=1 Tax=Dyadobacter psychrotolerans TaxID=2541721 RepID=A0A4R5DMY4_9BACT|nr:helix-turn-helix domain-containing protein [Dyadobacter psychrotolerans]TDE13351.1 AraC family transcriptional regulator [Dyadobacter psychrotolerans]
MRFEMHLPSEILKSYVQAFAIQENANESTYKVLPGTSLVIGFQFKGKLSYLENGHEIPLETFGITGLQNSYRIFKNTPETGTVLVFFKEGGAAAFFKNPLHELFRESVSLDNFMLRSELLLLEERLCEASTDQKKIGVVEQFLIARMNPGSTDQLVVAALSIIHKNKGTIRIKDLADQLHISQSPLEKRFRQAVGASPKKFASIVRLKNVIEQQREIETLTRLGYEAGYYDQAHFIKEFRTFTGEPPEKYFKKK